MKISNVVVLTEENIQNMEQGMYWLSEICCCSVFLITLWTKIYAALEEVLLFLFLIVYGKIFCGSNGVKCAVIKIQNVNVADDYERTLNWKWPNKQSKILIYFI